MNRYLYCLIIGAAVLGHAPVRVGAQDLAELERPKSLQLQTARDLPVDLTAVVLVLMICWLLLRIVRLYTVAKNLATSHRRRSTKSEIRFDFGDNDADESAPV